MNTYNLTGDWHTALTKKLQDMRKSYKEAGMLVKTVVMEDITEIEKVLEDVKRKEATNSETSTLAKSIGAPPIIKEKKKKNSETTKQPKGKRKSSRKESSDASIEEIEKSAVLRRTSSNKTAKKTKKQVESDSEYSPMDDFNLSVPVLPVTRGRGRGRGGRGRGRGNRGGRGTKKKTIKLWLPSDPYERAAILRAKPHLLQF